MYPFLLLFLLVINPLIKPTPDVNMELTIRNIKSPKGTFVISFYNIAADFPKPGRDKFTQKVTVNDTLPHTIKITLPEEGWYAIAMYQDELNSGKIKRDEIGIPEEPYAFSNNIRPKMKAPDFAVCKFWAGKGDAKPEDISLIQPRFQVKP